MRQWMMSPKACGGVAEHCALVSHSYLSTTKRDGLTDRRDRLRSV